MIPDKTTADKSMMIPDKTTDKSMYMMPDKTTAVKGDTLTVTFGLDLPPGIELSTLWFTLNYDTDILRLIPGEIQFPGKLTSVSTGPYYFTLAPKGTEAQPGGDVIKLTFEVLDDSREAIIDLKIDRACTPDDISIELSAPAPVVITNKGVMITFLRIATANGMAPPILAVSRNSTIQFSAIVNEGATTDGIEWLLSNPDYATVDAKTGLVRILNKTGTVSLIATTENDVSHNITLRIT
jgi:hypothetical protein